MMNRAGTRSGRALISAGCCLLVAAGCPRRTEKIQIGRDGSVSVEATFTGEPENFDALPSSAGGWRIEHSTTQEDEKEVPVLTATQHFRPGADLPASFTAPGDADELLALRFPTGVSFAEEPGATRYEFRRRYLPRQWAPVEYWRSQIMDDNIQELTEKPAEELSADERIEIIQAFAVVEALKQIEFGREAVAAMGDSLPMEAWLRARRALLNYYELVSENFDEIMERCRAMPEHVVAACVGQEAERILAEGYRRMLDSLLTDSGLGAGWVARFDQEYGRVQRAYELTRGLGDQQFEVEVAMPGTEMVSNADMEDCDVQAGVCTGKWSFDGKAFRDRDFELIMIARLPSGFEAVEEVQAEGSTDDQP